MKDLSSFSLIRTHKISRLPTTPNKNMSIYKTDPMISISNGISMFFDGLNMEKLLFAEKFATEAVVLNILRKKIKR